jgi:hypothetical protein
VRRLLLLTLATLLAACRGEPVPRDYQNAPPAMRHPPLKKSQTPTAAGMPAAAPEPSTGVEGANITRKPAQALPPAPKVKDQAPATTRT